MPSGRAMSMDRSMVRPVALQQEFIKPDVSGSRSIQNRPNEQQAKPLQAPTPTSVLHSPDPSIPSDSMMVDGESSQQENLAVAPAPRDTDSEAWTDEPEVELDGFAPESEWSEPVEPAVTENSLRRHSDRSRRRSVREIPSRSASYYRQDEDTDDDRPNPLEMTCEDFRRDLLTNPITEIELDISPHRAEIESEQPAVHRQWTGPDGAILATGTMVDLRHGYVIVEQDTGGRVKIAYARLSDADWAVIAEHWRLPVECGIGGTFVTRCWTPQTFTWTASALCHKPLYFENIQLERYGHSAGPFMQPIHSTAHFFVSLVSWPYQTTIHPPNECQYALGFYRPGNCAPWLRYPIPFSTWGTQYRTY